MTAESAALALAGELYVLGQKISLKADLDKWTAGFDNHGR